MPYSPATDDDLRHMLDALGVASVDELYADLPPGIRLYAPLDLPLGVAEPELVRLSAERERCTNDLRRRAGPCARR